jgi:predicted nucleotide-binding protein
VLIIREEGAKMPADLGGVIYESFTNKSLEERLELFLKKSIWSVPDERG